MSVQKSAVYSDITAYPDWPVAGPEPFPVVSNFYNFSSYEQCADFAVAEPDPYVLDFAPITNLSRTDPLRLAYVKVMFWNADNDAGQMNDVYLNDQYIGTVLGRTDTYSVTRFQIPVSLVNLKNEGTPGRLGVNTIRVTSGNAEGGWFVCFGWAQLVVRIQHAPTLNQNRRYPAFEDTTLVVPKANGFLSDAVDLDGDPITLVSWGSTSFGNISINNDGSFTYRARPDWHGTDSFPYNVTDGTGRYSSATVFIEVAPVDDPPRINPEATIARNTTLNYYTNAILYFPLLGGTLADLKLRASTVPEGYNGVPVFYQVDNIYPPDHDVFEIVATQPAAGTGTVSIDNRGVLKYTPPLNWNGTTSFTVQARDTNTVAHLTSPVIPYRITLNGKPALEKIRVRSFHLKATSCAGGGIRVDNFSLTAGSRAVMRNNAGAFSVYGAPTQILAEVAPFVNSDYSGDHVCRVVVPRAMPPDASRTWAFGGCGPCYKCFQQMLADCATTYRFRLQAMANPTSPYAESPWSDDFFFKPDCVGAAAAGSGCMWQPPPASG